MIDLTPIAGGTPAPFDYSALPSDVAANARAVV
jgi:hypothetical protein